jgi:hypothetical protein
MQAHPAKLAARVRRVVELGARRLELDEESDQALEHQCAANAGLRRIVGRRAMADLADGLRNVGAQEHQAVLVGMAEAEADIGFAKSPHPLQRVGHGPFDLADRLDQMPEGLIAKRQHQRFLVLEVQVQRRRRNADAIGDPPDRGRIVALLQEQLLGGLEDLLTAGMALAAAFAAGRQHCREPCQKTISFHLTLI